VTATYTDRKNGEGTRGLSLDHTPVAGVTAVKVDGLTIDPQAATGEPGWVLLGNRVELVGHLFGRGVGNVEIAYLAGFGASPPFDVEMAVVEMVADLYRKRDRIGQMSRSIGGESVTFQTLTLPNSVQSVIDLYRRRSV
jgi:hypothetical protein